MFTIIDWIFLFYWWNKILKSCICAPSGSPISFTITILCTTKHLNTKNTYFLYWIQFNQLISDKLQTTIYNSMHLWNYIDYINFKFNQKTVFFYWITFRSDGYIISNLYKMHHEKKISHMPLWKTFKIISFLLLFMKKKMMVAISTCLILYLTYFTFFLVFCFILTICDQNKLVMKLILLTNFDLFWTKYGKLQNIY